MADALTTAARALRYEPDEMAYLELLVERPFPAYGDVLLTASERYSSAGSRVWLALDGTVLRTELD